MTVQYSIQKMVSDGTLSTIVLGIQYLQRNDIYMRIAGEETPQSGAPSGYTWSFIDNTTIKILPVVPSGVEVVVYRRTDIDEMYNIYSQNAQFDEATIDENNQQLLYIAQEYLEQGLPGAGVDSLEYVNTVAGINYYRFKLTDGSYTPIFGVPDGTVELRENLLDSPLRMQGARFALRDVYSARDFSAIVGDGLTNDTVALQAAIDSVPSGGSFGFIGGKFLFDKLILSKPVVLFGDAELEHNGFRIKSSRVTSLLSGRQICRDYQSSSRAFQVLAYEDGADYDDIKILFNRFEGFFYSTDMRGREYSAAPSDPTNRVLKNTLIMGCTSIAPPGVPAGHFQHTGVTNAKCIACSTYGGINATSYNFINGNGFLIVQGCYDQDNTYGSLEIENNQITHGVVSCNAFGKQIWIDDSSNITITGNAVTDRILITAQSNDTDNITISGNSCSRISVTKFGTSPTGRHKSVHIAANTTYGEAGSNDVFTDDSVDRVTIENNSLNGEASNAIAMVRSANCDHLVRNNRSRTARPLTISGAVGRVIAYGNDNMTVSGASDSRHISNMMVPSTAYLDLPGKYLHGTKYTGNIAPGGTAAISLPIPDSGSLAFRGVGLLVMIRDANVNNISSYRIDGLYKVVGASTALTFGSAFSSQGVDAATVTVANNASTSDSINIVVSNTSGAKTFQVTVLPEVSSRLGTEE